MKKKIYSKIFNDLAAIRARNEAVAKNTADSAFSISEINECDTAMRLNSFALIKAEMENKDTAELKAKEEELTAKLESLLNKYGYKSTDFEPVYSCSKCSDTGRIGNLFCSCFNTRYIDEVKRAANLEISAPFTFNDCDFSRISNENQKKFLEETYKKAKTYCKMFSTQKTQNMLLTGATGTGKTCVASAIANELVNRGITVIFVSAFELLQKMKECHFALPEDRDLYLEDYMSVDLLIIDDLGVEQILRNITCEYLLLILCEREAHGKSTIVTTNLGDKILSRYGDRIASRLTNQKNTLIRNFNGNDMRNQR